ncbi:vWA domain-containing protein [Sneathiella aquimaris]|uniref:vWA domain-containing protein n=1 Tax=Sneathiella aquimaris TaxID=2599305 RepID=UPI00146E48CE|nr:vWA domain-containing protein [Sneathiella aquimaris]
MSCGLGAVILVLILLKLQPDDAPIELDPLQEQLEQMQKEDAEIASAISKLLESNKKLDIATEEQISQYNALLAAISATQGKIDEKKNQLETLKEQIRKSPPLKKKDSVQNTNQGEETYLMGLKVEGPRIVFLIDSSASMTDELLLDIIRRKAGSTLDKKKAPKWVRTQRIVKWLANRIPAGSQAVFLTFNEKAVPLGPTTWFSGQNATAVKAVFKQISEVVPTGATNLEAALQAAKSLTPMPTNYYIVTDGLPTTGNSRYKSLNPFSKCTSLFGQSNTISGECRYKLFQHTVKTSGLQSSFPVNIILLPLEGDPGAAPAYWSWTFLSGGLLISPAQEWP